MLPDREASPHRNSTWRTKPLTSYALCKHLKPRLKDAVTCPAASLARRHRGCVNAAAAAAGSHLGAETWGSPSEGSRTASDLLLLLLLLSRYMDLSGCDMFPLPMKELGGRSVEPRAAGASCPHYEATPSRRCRGDGPLGHVTSPVRTCWRPGGDLTRRWLYYSRIRAQ